MNNKTVIDFRQLVSDHGEGVYRLCKAYVGQTADLDDVHQEALINIWRSLKSFRGEAKITTWIYRITVNTAITYRRKSAKKIGLESSVDDYTHLTENTREREEKQNQEERYRQLSQAIATLKPDQRIIIGLFLEDLSYKEIADVIGKDTNYVGVKLLRIKEKLSKLMKS